LPSSGITTDDSAKKDGLGFCFEHSQQRVRADDGFQFRLFPRGEAKGVVVPFYAPNQTRAAIVLRAEQVLVRHSA
jgi:hypothetical protein